MKKLILANLAILFSASLMSCSNTASSGCGKAGYYADQAECQNSISSGSCSSTTVQTTDQNLVCWRASTTSNQTGNTTGGTTTGACSGAAPAWTKGAWTPATCGPGIVERTRTVSCDYPCPCAGTMPLAKDPCVPNLYNSQHYETQCTGAGGTVYTTAEGNRVCRFNQSSCPSGWYAHSYNGMNFTITTAGSAEEHTNCYGGRNTIYTGYHSTFSPAKAQEYRDYCSARTCFGCKTMSRVYANISAILCY